MEHKGSLPGPQEHSSVSRLGQTHSTL